MRSLRPASILLGVLADKVTFVASALALAGLVGVSAPAFGTLAMCCGVAATAVGGFVAAWHARSRYLRHGLAVGAMAVAISLGRFVVNTQWLPAEAAAQHPLWWELLGWTSAPVAGLLGGWVAGTRARRSLVQPIPRPGEARWGLWLPLFLAIIALFAFAEQL